VVWAEKLTWQVASHAHQGLQVSLAIRWVHVPHKSQTANTETCNSGQYVNLSSQNSSFPSLFVVLPPGIVKTTNNESRLYLEWAVTIPRS
jgi:hypothetical protein